MNGFVEHFKTSTFSEREADILKPLASAEVVEKEEAHFDTEISEHDIPGEWKLRGQVLTRSPVRYLEKVILLLSIKSSPGFLMYLLFFSDM